MFKIVTVSVFFTDSGAPKTGLSPTITITDLSDNSVVISSGAMSEVGSGVYKYAFSNYEYSKEYAFVSDGTSTLSDSDRYKFGGNIEPNSAYLSSGGGLGMTGDMIFEFKKMADNILTKKHFDKVMAQIAKQLGILDKITEINEKSKEEINNLSKMSNEINVKLSNLGKKDNKELIKTLKSNSLQFTRNIEELAHNVNVNNTEVNKLYVNNKKLFTSLKVGNTKELTALKEELEKNKQNLDNVHKDISLSNSEKGAKLEEVKKALKDTIAKISDVSVDIKGEIEVVKKDIISQTAKDIGNISSELEQLQQNNMSKFTEDSKRQKKEEELTISKFNTLNAKIEELSSNIIKKYDEHRTIIEKSREKDKKALVDDLNSIKAEVDKVLTIKKDLINIEQQIKDNCNKSASKRDINFITVNNEERFKKLNKKIGEIGNVLKDKLIQISNNKPRRADDLSEVQAQIDLLNKE